MIKNVIIINDFDYVQGGASKVAIQTANLIKSKYKDISVYFFSGDHSEESTLDENIIKICTNQGEFFKSKNRIRGALNGIYNVSAKKKLKELLSSLNRKETIIHIHGWTKCLSSSVFDIIFKMNFKVVLTMHDYFLACPNGGYFNYSKNRICKLKPLSKKCIKCNCDSRNYYVKLYRVIRQLVQNKIVKVNDRLKDVISISDFSERILKKSLNKEIKITKIYNPIEFDENKNSIDYTKNEYYLYVGRVSKEKGVDIFCKAISELNLKGLVVGDGPEKKELEKQYTGIKFVGWKNFFEVKEYMKKAKALVFPSRWYECAPLTPLEILQYGIPCIISEDCASMDYLYEGYNGISFSIKKKDINKKILEFEKKEDPILINIDRFLNNNYTEKIMDLYLKVLKDEKKDGK